MMKTEYEQKIADYYLAKYDEYEMSIIQRTKLVSDIEYAKVRRQRNELEQGICGYRFDRDIAVKPLVWMALNLVFPKGKKRGKPIRLAPWQAWDTMVLFGWVKDGAPDERRFVDAFVFLSRKNGKSTWAGAILDYLAFSEQEGVNCYIAATSLDQAGETFERAADSLRLAGHKGVRVQNSKNNKMIIWGTSKIVAIASEPKDGKLAYGAIVDEYHQHNSNDVINSIHSGNVSDQQSLLVRITTAGTSLGGVCHEEYKKVKRILNGEIRIDRYFVSLYELDPSDNPDDPSTWPKANPNWGISIDPELFRSAYDYARASEADFNDFKTKNLNLWCHSLMIWANMAVWMEKCSKGSLDSSYQGKEAYGALDLSSVSDFTSFTLTFRIGDKYHQHTHFWIADSMRTTLARQCRIPLENWIQEGWVTATPGEVIDYTVVAEYINTCYEDFSIHFIACDKWKIQELLAVMPPWFEDVAVEFSQGIKSMSPTIIDFEREYKQGSVINLGNPVIDWMMSCAEIYQDTSGNIKLVKPKARTGKRIDGVITSVMSLNMAKTQDVSSISDEDIHNMIGFF